MSVYQRMVQVCVDVHIYYLMHTLEAFLPRDEAFRDEASLFPR